jgi:hypothetical protein
MRRSLALLTLTVACSRSHAPFAPTVGGPPPPVDAGAAANGPPAAGPVPASVGPHQPIGPATIADGVLPLAWFDGATGTCGYLPSFHVEAIDIATGATRWKASWQRVLGQRPDGDLVVSGGSAVAVLGRNDGAVRFQCAPPAGSLGDDADWYQLAGRRET